MATKMFEEVTLTTQGDRDIIVRPLTIRTLRKFMEKMGELGNGEDEVITDEKGIQVMMEAAVIAILQCNKDIEDVDELEDELDLPTINKVLEVAGGIKVDDPSLQPTQAA